MGLLSFLFGSTAEVVLDDNTATKHYYKSTSSQTRKNEVDNLEILYEDLGNGTVRVPALLTVGYGDDDSINYITTERVRDGWTLSQLRENGYNKEARQAVKLAKQAIFGTGIHLPDLETDGNILVTLDKDGNINNVWLVDVGDIY